MGETIDDTETFTIALTAPCPTPSVSVTLVSQDGLTVTVNVQTSPGAGATWKSYNPKLGWDDGVGGINGVANGHHTHTYAAPGTYSIGVYGGNTCGKSNDANVVATVTAPVIPAKGEIVGLDAPASVKHGASYDIQAKTKNTGGGSGTFKMQLLIGGAVKSTSAQFTLAPGATSSDKIPAATAPTTGTSMSFTVRCIRIT